MFEMKKTIKSTQADVLRSVYSLTFKSYSTRTSSKKLVSTM